MLQDPDLEFLAYCDNEDLDILVNYLTKAKDGNRRLTEDLTDREIYKKYYPDHKKYWREITDEIQCFGANTIATLFRGGEGVPYREILTDVCNKLKVNFNSESPIEIIESNLLMKILTDSLDKMNSDELKKVVETTGIKTTHLTPQAVTFALQVAVRMGGFASYQVAVIVANSVARAVLGRGLSLAANASLTRILGIFSGPIGWLLTSLWTLVTIAGPAYRVTIPCAIHIAYMLSLIHI